MSYRDRESNPTENRLRELLFGRKIVSAKKIEPAASTNYAEGQLVLDDGTILLVGGNDGCGGCPSGEYWLTDLNTADNAITNVVVEEEFTGKYDDDGFYRIFVIAEDQNRHLVAAFEGSDGNGYYGSGYWISVVPSPSDGEQPVNERWAIHKMSRIYDGGTYLGPSLDRADVNAGPYATEAEAKEVVLRLDTVNSVGWVVVPYRPR